MNEKTIKITTLALYAVAFICCVLAVIMLLMPFAITLEETVYAVPPGEKRIEVTSDSSYHTRTFFGYINFLELQGWSPTIETLLIVSLTITLIISIALLVIEGYLFIHKQLQNKTLKKTILALSAFSLISLLFSIIIQSDVSTWISCGTEKIYLSDLPEWNIYKETMVRGSVLMVPIIIFMFIAFSSQTIAGILKLIYINSIQYSENVEKTNLNIQPHTTNEINRNDSSEN